MTTTISKRINALKRVKIEADIVRVMRRTGYKRSQIEVLPAGQMFADRKPVPGTNYFYYNGPLDEKTRAFCRLLLKLDKVFSDEQIQSMSDELGYDVLEYCGSYNCRHQWIQFRGKFINTPDPTLRQIRVIINNGIEA